MCTDAENMRDFVSYNKNVLYKNSAYQLTQMQCETLTKKLEEISDWAQESS